MTKAQVETLEAVAEILESLETGDIPFDLIYEHNEHFLDVIMQEKDKLMQEKVK